MKELYKITFEKEKVESLVDNSYWVDDRDHCVAGTKKVYSYKQKISIEKFDTEKITRVYYDTLENIKEQISSLNFKVADERNFDMRKIFDANLKKRCIECAAKYLDTVLPDIEKVKTASIVVDAEDEDIECKSFYVTTNGARLCSASDGLKFSNVLALEFENVRDLRDLEEVSMKMTLNL